MTWFYKMCSKGAKLYYSLFFKLSVDGLENIDLNQHYVVCANHSNAQDPFVLGGILPIEVRFMGKKEIFKNKIVAAFVTALGVFPVDRDNNDLKAIKMALKILKDKGNLALFPEGTRNKGVEPLPVKSGVALLAVKTKTPVLPITIDGTFKFFKPLKVSIHEPIVLDALYDQKAEPDVLEDMSQKIMQGIYAKRELS